MDLFDADEAGLLLLGQLLLELRGALETARGKLVFGGNGGHDDGREIAKQLVGPDKGEQVFPARLHLTTMRPQGRFLHMDLLLGQRHDSPIDRRPERRRGQDGPRRLQASRQGPVRKMDEVRIDLGMHSVLRGPTRPRG